MATAVSAHKPFDIRTSGTYTIRLSDSVSKPASSRGLTSVRYNHKPAVSSQDGATERIDAQNAQGMSTLLLQDGTDEYEYEGQAGNDEHTLVLVPDESGEGYVLELLDMAMVYNLTRAPWEKDSAKLAENYTILPAVEAMRSERETREINGSNDNDEPDSDNPWDYRHFVSAFSPSTAPVRAQHPTTTMNSPALSHTASQAASSQGTPISRPARKPVNPMMPNRKPKPKTSTPAHVEPASKRNKPDQVPEVRVSSTKAARKMQKPQVEDIVLDDVADDEDDGDLVFDDAPSKKSVSKHNSGLGVNGGAAPMSLRSVASSPGSRVASPAPGYHGHHHTPRSHAADDDLVMDIDEPHTTRNGYHDDEHDAEDDDVDDLHIGSPARHQPAQQKREHPSLQSTGRRRSSAHVQGEAEGDEDDELEMEMLRAMAEEEEDEPRPAIAVEEEEESEEE